MATRSPKSRFLTLRPHYSHGTLRVGASFLPPALSAKWKRGAAAGPSALRSNRENRSYLQVLLPALPLHLLEQQSPAELHGSPTGAQPPGGGGLPLGSRNCSTSEK